VGYLHKLLKIAGSACALALLAATSASANLTPSYVSSSTAAGITTYNYRVELDGAQMLKNNDYFVLYDFAGYNGVTTHSNLFTNPIVTNVGPYPPGPPPVDPASTADNASLPNLQFVYNGADLTGAFDFGIFTIQTTESGRTLGRFGSQTHSILPGNPSISNDGNIIRPAAVTPEAGSLALLLPGLVPLAVGFRRRLSKRTRA